VTLIPDPAGDPAGVNVLRGRVRLTEYLGREHDLEVVLDSGQVVAARVARPAEVGQAVGLRLPTDRVVVLPSEDARA
jgi:TOBE domain-containing protein